MFSRWAVLVAGSALAALTLACGATGRAPENSAGAQRPVVPAGAQRPLGPGERYGMSADLQYLTGRALSRRLDAYRALGVRWARFQLIWSNVQRRGRRDYEWWPYDAVVAGLRARGIRPLMVIGTSPPWARPPGCNEPTCAPANTAAFAAFAQRAARRYARRGVRHWEIWNEPNYDAFWKPRPDPTAFAALLKSSYRAIKTADPRAVVISGGTAPAATETDREGRPLRIAPVDFLSGVYAAGAQGSFDAVGHHPYTYPNLPPDRGELSAWWQMYGTDVSLRSLMIENGDGAKRIWGTEFGSHTDPLGDGYVDEPLQARMVARAYAEWRRHAWTGPLIYHTYLDAGTDRSDRENFFGLVRADGTHKPAHAAYGTGALAARRAGRSASAAAAAADAPTTRSAM